MTNFFNRRNLNIDITHRCALECPMCQRQTMYKKYGKKVPGKDISISEIKKIISFYKDLSFCGQYSDPVHRSLSKTAYGYQWCWCRGRCNSFWNFWRYH